MIRPRNAVRWIKSSRGVAALTPPTDTTPDTFAFTTQNDVPRGSVRTSNQINVAGINAPAPISISSGEYQIGSGSWASAPGTVTQGQGVRVRHTSASGFSASMITVLTIGGVSATFTSTTLVEDQVPDAFGFVALTNATRSTAYESAEVTLAGTNSDAPFSVSGGSLVVNGAAPAASGTVPPGAAIKARLTSSSSYSTLARAIVTIGGVSANFDVTTEADPTPTPTPTIPLISPGPGWDGTANPANIPAQNWTPYGTVDDAIWPNAQFTLADLMPIEALTYIRAIATTAAIGGVDKVYAAFEDGDEKEVPWAAHPITGKKDYIFAIGDTSARNGLGRLRIRVVPKNGLERVYWKTVLHNANPSGAGYVQRVNRYVDPTKADDGGDGLTWATAKKTTYAALQSFTTLECSTKICRVNIAKGTTPWFEMNGRPGGVAKSFSYRPEFIGSGRKGSPNETKLSWRNQAASPTDSTQSWQFRWFANGPRPRFSNMLIDWATTVVFYTGAVFEDFDEIGDLGPGGARDGSGFPYGVHKSDTGGNDITNSNSWRDGQSVGGYVPGIAGRWGGERYTKSNYTSLHHQPSTIQERWDGEEVFSADCVFVNGEGDWLVDNVAQTQGVQLELRLHSELDLIVTAVEPNTPSAGATRVSFTGTFSAAMPNDVNNLFLRVTQSVNGVDAGDVEYPEAPDGSRACSTTGYWIDGSTSQNRNLPFTSNKLIIYDAGNRLAQLVAGDKLRAYARYHGDSGQTNYDLGGQDYECRENITLRHRLNKLDNIQRYLVQIGALAANGTASDNGTAGAPTLTSFTVSSSGRVATFSPSIPPALKQHCWIEPTSGLATLEARRVVRIINSTQVYLDASFTKSSDGTAYDLPAGTTFAGYRGIHGFIETGSMQHKASPQPQIMQFQNGLSGSAIIQCSLPGWTTAQAAVGIYLPVNRVGWRRGMYDLRFINTIVHAIEANIFGQPIPTDVQVINSHVEKALPGANATVIDTDTGYVFGYSPTSVLGPLTRNYIPDPSMTRTVATVYERRRRDGTAIEVGSRIGAF